MPFLVAQVCPCQNSWLETHFVSLAKISEYAVFQLSISYWSVLIETVQTEFLWANGRIRFPTKKIYVIHSKLFLIDDLNFG